MTASKTGAPVEVTFEINQALSSCDSSCSGVCISTSKDSRCVSRPLKQDIDSILRYTNVSLNFEEVLANYRIVGSEDIVLNDIRPVKNIAVEWSEAMRQELVSLSQKRIITLSRSDIESISSLAKRGQSGFNYRIVQDDKKQWVYYDELPDARLTSERDCRAYLLSNDSLQNVALQPFYLIPIIITLGSIIALIALIIIANLLTSGGRRRQNLKRQMSNSS